MSDNTCEFCNNLKWRHYIVPVRSTSTDDNICEYGSPDIVDGYVLGHTCHDCGGCAEGNWHFTLRAYENRIGIDYLHRFKHLVVDTSSEMIDINFCPWCGRQLSEEIKPFSKCCLGDRLKEKESL